MGNEIIQRRTNWKGWDEDGQMDVQGISMWKKVNWRPPPVNGPGKDRAGDEEEQTEMVWTCG